MTIIRASNFFRATCCLLASVALAVSATAQPPQTLLINAKFLADQKTVNRNPRLLAAVRADADEALKKPAHSVTEKKPVPPSGDKHDYMSLATYFWPNPDTPNHLPYIRHDGKRNPELDTISDHRFFSDTADNVHALALGYYLTGNQAYAKRASLLLHVWFLDPATRMNPNLKYAQAIRGVNEGRGIGLIDMKQLPEMLDGVALLKGSAAWSAADDAALHSWFADYYTWLTTSANGLDEASQKNNHGSWYDVQASSIAIYLGRVDDARKIVEAAKLKRIALQIEPDGQQPLETARTSSYGYSCFNLAALINLADIAQILSVDLWDYRSPRGGSIRAAVDFMTPFALGQKQWEHETIKGFDPSELRPSLAAAAIHFHDPAYIADERRISAKSEKDATQILLLETEFDAMPKPR